jgi:hypothetical protein
LIGTGAHTHLDPAGEGPPYTHSHEHPECTHSWQTCPVHGRGGAVLPPFRVVLTCLYGGAELKNGGTWDQRASDDVIERAFGSFK